MKGELLDLGGGGDVVLQERDRQRARSTPGNGIEIVADAILDGAVEIRFIRITPGVGEHVELSQPFETMLLLGGDWGLAGSVDDGGRRRTVWLPRPPRQVGPRDEVGRMEIVPVAGAEWTVQTGSGFSIDLEPLPAGAAWSLPVVLLDDPDGGRLRELERLSHRSWPRLKKSDWFDAQSPAQVWESFVDGSIYDPRPSLVDRGRFRCQQCAGAWWSYLFLGSRESESGLLRTMATEIAWSVRTQQVEPCGWRHGLWRDDAETHLRFFNDGIGLLLSEAEHGGDESWVRAAETAAEELVDGFSDELRNEEIWFLHDSLEATGAAPPNRGPDLGQSDSNTLCLNTHVQALTVLKRLHRLQEGASAARTLEVYRRGLDALRTVLELDSAPVLYRLLGAGVRPAVESKQQPGLRARSARVLAFRVFPRLYWWIRRRFPRMVYPNGFIERDMTSSMLADDYHVLNLKDLLILDSLDPHRWLKRVITKAMGFQRLLDIEKGLARSPLFLEATDVMVLYRDLIADDENRSATEEVSWADAAPEAGSLDRRMLQVGQKQSR